MKQRDSKNTNLGDDASGTTDTSEVAASATVNIIEADDLIPSLEHVGDGAGGAKTGGKGGTCNEVKRGLLEGEK